MNPRSRRIARGILVGAATLGLLADMLLREGPLGIGLPLWMLVLAGTTVTLVWRRGELTREAAAWLAAAVLFSGGTVWRDSETLQVFDFLAVLGLLIVLGVVLTGNGRFSVMSCRLRDLAWNGLRTVGDGAGGGIPRVVRSASLGSTLPAARPERRSALLRGLAVTLPVILLFGALFSGADPMFAKLVRMPGLDFGNLLSHVLLAGFFAWITAGWMGGSLLRDGTARVADGFPLHLGRVEITTLLGALNLLFATFVLVQVGWLFGGAELVQRTTGLSVAEYARRGFFELVWVSVLLVPLLIATRAAILPDDTDTKRRFVRLAPPLMLLLGAVMVSALGRMALYIRYYGLSEDRVLSTAFMLWIAIVIVTFAVTVLRDRPRAFVGVSLVSGLGVLAALNAVSPDVVVARVNIDRARAQAAVPDARPLDVSYLAFLSGEAVPQVVSLLLAPPIAPAGSPARAQEIQERCSAVQTLLIRWTGQRNPDGSRVDRRHRRWTAWNYGRALGERVVAGREADLRRVTCLDNGQEVPFGTRDYMRPAAAPVPAAVPVPAPSTTAPTSAPAQPAR